MSNPPNEAASASPIALVRPSSKRGTLRVAPGPAGLWANPAARAEVIGSAEPFCTWPAAALLRLATASRTVRYKPRDFLLRGGAAVDHVSVVAAGAVESSVMTSDGRRVVFSLDGPGRLYGLSPLIDGEPTINDTVFVESGVGIDVPFRAIHAELAAEPALWASLAREANARGRRYTDQIKSFVFDELPHRAAGLLLGLLQHSGAASASGRVLRLPQERFAEMLGVSRQTVTALVRGFAHNGLVEWRYGQVTLIDFERLQAMADMGLGRMTRRPPPTERAPKSMA